MGHLMNYTCFECEGCDENRILLLLTTEHSYWRYCQWYSDLMHLQEHFKVTDRTYFQAVTILARPWTRTW
jgi:hypothetical protein